MGRGRKRGGGGGGKRGGGGGGGQSSGASGLGVRTTQPKPKRVTTRNQLKSGAKAPGGLNIVKSGSVECYSFMTQEEFDAYNQYIEAERKMPNPECLKEQAESMTRRYFSFVQENEEKFPWIVDYEFHESMSLRGVPACGVWVHLNFKAKHKDTDAEVIFFVELDVAKREVTCLELLNIPLDMYSANQCSLCGEDVCNSFGSGRVYHPSKGFNYVIEG